MSDLEVHSIGSGSCGNAMLLKTRSSSLLIDAGVGIRRLTEALKNRSVNGESLQGILLTHEHSDHIHSVPSLMRKWNIPVIANCGTLHAVSEKWDLQRTVEMPTGSERRIGDFLVRSFSLSHDAADPVGYLIHVHDQCIAYATDTGFVSEELRDACNEAKLCILESNHDTDWLWRGPYPYEMKKRISSDKGHLSNAQTADLIIRLLEENGPACFWLAHLSAVNNSPSLARKQVLNAISIATKVSFHLDVALRDRPSLLWSPNQTSFQLRMNI